MKTETGSIRLGGRLRLQLAGLCTILLGLSFAPAALADGATGCKNPAWAPQSMPGFVIDSCEHKDWDSVDYDLPAGSKTLQGSRDSVSYTLKDESKDPKAAAARDYFIAAGEKAGATLISDPTASWEAELQQKSAVGDFWYTYRHGSGSEDSTGSYTLTTIKITPLPQDVAAQPMTGPLNVSGKTCSNPPWLARQFAWFKVDSCEHKKWDQVALDLPTGEKKIEGARLTVNYVLTDDKKDPVALAVQKNYVTALQKIGAKLLTDPTAEYTAVLTQKSPTGEFWYIYKHDSGNSESTGSYSLTTIQITPFLQVVVAQQPKGLLTGVAGKGCKQPPWLVKQFDYYKLSDCTKNDYDSITLDLPDGSKTIAGHYLDVNYRLMDEKKDATALYVQKNYVNALEKIGAKLVSDPNDSYQAVLMQKTSDGELWYIYKHGSGNEESTGSYSLTALQVGGPPPKTCKIEVYGVNFDFDKSDIKPESEPVLNQLLALFTADPSYSAEVGGHTDNVGKPAYNMKLSDRRAAAVKAWLVAHGVSADRLTSHGYGDTVPLVPNTSEANRAKNRRVELKRKNCKQSG